MNRHIELYAGDDYKDKLAITANIDLTGIVAVRFIAFNHRDCINQMPVIDVVGSIKNCFAVIDLPRAETLKLKVGLRNHTFIIKGLLSNGDLITLERGIMSVLWGGL
jgi:hypothetical protein